jgi:hypothetical protein
MAARVKVDGVVEELRNQFTNALAEAVRKTVPGVKFNENKLYDEFLRAVRQNIGSASISKSNVKVGE